VFSLFYFFPLQNGCHCHGHQSNATIQKWGLVNIKESYPPKKKRINSVFIAIVYLDIYHSRVLTVTVSTGVPGFFPSSTAKLYILIQACLALVFSLLKL
jgi:hypothetical protein